MDEIELQSLDDKTGVKNEKKPYTQQFREHLSQIPRPKLNPRKWLYQTLPILTWLPKYNLEDGISDFIAGITVGLTMIPQGIAYALVASLPAQYGLYSAFMSCFVFLFLGASKDLSIGPEAVLAILTLEITLKGIEYVILTTFLSGIIIFVLAVLKLGVVIDFMSVPVNAGFTSAAAITIASSQVRGIFGLAILKKSGLVGFVGTWADIFINFDTIRASDTILGLACIAVLLSMRELKGVNWFTPIPENTPGTLCQRFWGKLIPSHRERVMKKSLWLLSIASNAIVVIVSALIAFACDPVLPEINGRNTTFILTGNIEAGLPPFVSPVFNIHRNETGETVSFGEMVQNLGSAIFVIPIISILANVAIAKSFARGKPIDASQNMFALGICNILCSFVKSMPVTSSFSRSAVNEASGVKTPLSGLYTGAMVLLALAFMMPYCAYIPIASLSAVIISAVIFMVDFKVVKPMWKSSKLDLTAATITFVACLFWNLAYGILVGVGVQLIFILYKVARPNVEITEKNFNGQPYVVIRPDRSPVFPSVSYLRTLVNKTGLKQGESTWPIVIDCLHISSADFTATKGFTALVADFKLREQPLIFFNMATSVGEILLDLELQNVLVCSSEYQLELILKDISIQQNLKESSLESVMEKISMDQN